MGKHEPWALTRALWWRNNFFGFRGRDEHRKLRLGPRTQFEVMSPDGSSNMTSNCVLVQIYLRIVQ
ncbi:hypothetical protein DPMN_050331 [Dreissena polymorpha]|uniref:Uncharacterized protein n=1 Tax=Dreissena polymorpha TaxID=45954 RepID=A0A9D4HL80_DREPO|nr:hypothetical protein DPMN_050331 [Dreissena polymorpha]